MGNPKIRNGFTLIELVVVIVILGILAVIALPRFINLKSNAAESTVQGVSGALHSSINLANAQIQIDNAEDSVDYSGITISLTAGMPAASAGNLRAMLDIDVPETWTPDWKTVPCGEPEFCIVGNLAPNHAEYVEVPGFPLTVNTDLTAYIWPKGYTLSSNGCYAFYINEASKEENYSGAITDGC